MIIDMWDGREWRQFDHGGPFVEIFPLWFWAI